MQSLWGGLSSIGTYVWGSPTNKQPSEEEKKEKENIVMPPKEKSTWPISETLWNILSGKIGADVMNGISLPAWLYEPLTILQRSCETLAFGSLLNVAAEQVDPLDRLAYVAAFAVSGVSGTERYHTNFNPMLGETYEYIDPKANFKFLAEKVSHRPPIFANHAKNDNFTFWQNSRLKTKFLGNALDLDTQGSSHLVFPKTKDHFWFRNPATRVQNILVGSKWLEHYGELRIVNTVTKHTCVIPFSKCSFYSYNGAVYDITGFVCDDNGKQCIQLTGKWNQSLTAKWLVDTEGHKKGDVVVLWTCPKDHYTGDKYNLTRFAASLNELSEERKNSLPPTDSRLRPDRMALEQGNIDAATTLKQKLEERQRAYRNKLQQEGKEWTPTWFKPVTDSNEPDGLIWVYKGNYWETKDTPDNVKGSPCDFKSFTS
eukprot:TRINITY_DN490_c0_g1_i1.p1 TRINITY_DN490_c0_g1~~TRINITY_DN490_c0_g1_i1.p1  ORF type:complete len:428 (+),score=67.39 TRINITY_DN490_c0_g1_i1:124-1407(+)